MALLPFLSCGQAALSSLCNHRERQSNFEICVAARLGRPWKAVSFHPFDDTCADGEWVPDAAESVDEVRALLSPTSGLGGVC